MIFHNVAQRGQTWHLLRISRPTASEFHRIVTPKGKLSEQAKGYMHTLLAQMMLGREIDNYQSQWMQRGIENEDKAIEAYEFMTGLETSPGGFCVTDDSRVGCSPDRLVGDDGGIEMKITAPNTHVGYLLSVEDFKGEKKPQVQGCMYVCEREWWDLVSWHPDLPPVIVRVKRDEDYIATLRDSLNAFCDTMDECRRKLETLYGKFPEIVLQTPPVDDIGEHGLDVTAEDIHRMFEESRR